MNVGASDIYGAKISSPSFAEFDHSWQTDTVYELNSLYDRVSSQTYKVDEEDTSWVGFGRDKSTLLPSGNAITMETLSRFLQPTEDQNAVFYYKEGTFIFETTEETVFVEMGDKITFQSFYIYKIFTPDEYKSFKASVEGADCSMKLEMTPVVQVALSARNEDRLMNILNDGENTFSLVTASKLETITQCSANQRKFQGNCKTCEELQSAADSQCKSGNLIDRLTLPSDYPAGCEPYACTTKPTAAPTMTPTYSPTPAMNATFCKKCSDLSVESCEDENSGLNCYVFNKTECRPTPKKYAACQNRFTKVECNKRHTYYSRFGFAYDDHQPRMVNGRRGVAACKWDSCANVCTDVDDRAQFALKEVRVGCTVPKGTNGVNEHCKMVNKEDTKKKPSSDEYFATLLSHATFTAHFKKMPAMGQAKSKKTQKAFGSLLEAERSASSAPDVCESAVDISSNAMSTGGGVYNHAVI